MLDDGTARRALIRIAAGDSFPTLPLCSKPQSEVHSGIALYDPADAGRKARRLG
jgi:hypothetical protein